MSNCPTDVTPVFRNRKTHKPILAVAWLFIVTLNVTVTSQAETLEPPSSIRLENGTLMWDQVPGATEYLIYYFDGPVPSSTVQGNYLQNTGGTSWPLQTFNAPFGYYTVVSTVVSNEGFPENFSAVTDGTIVPYLPTAQSSDTSAVLLSSGQTQSYFPGDDGATQAGVRTDSERYLVNGDGTFTDTLTQLVWIADSDCIPMVSWVDAINHANALTADGSGSCASLQDGSVVGDWRLANIVELLSHFDYSLIGAIGNVPLTRLSPLITEDFWSSTSFESLPTPNDQGLAWEVKFLTGDDIGSHIDRKFNLGRAWAVRDSQ